MHPILNNPYRVAGVLANATLKELERNKGKFNKYIEVGKEPKSEFDFEVFGTIERTKETLQQAFANLQQNQDKVSNALFWFLNPCPFDNTAIEYLKNGDEEKALEIWEKVTTDKDVNSKNFSAFNNLGTYKLLSRDKSDIKTGVEAKMKLIESDYFESLVKSVTDQYFKTDKEKHAEKLIDELLTEFKNQYSSSETLQLFSGCNGTTQNYLTTKFTEEPLYRIKTQIETYKKKRKEDKRDAYQFGLNLFHNAKDDLSLLKSLLGTSDLKYKTIADQLANEIMQCGIDYYNESQENKSSEDYLINAQELNEIALSIAVGRLVADRAKDSIATLEEMKDREINRAIAILNSIKLAYEKAIREIDVQVSSVELTMSFNKSIDYSKVDKMKDNCLEWDKVVEVIKNGISINNVEVIQRCSNKNKVSEYKILVEFLLGKLKYENYQKISYLRYWKTEKQDVSVYDSIFKISLIELVEEHYPIILGFSIPTTIVGAVVGSKQSDFALGGGIYLFLITSFSTIIFLYSLEDIGKNKQIAMIVLSIISFLFLLYLPWGIDGIIQFFLTSIALIVAILFYSLYNKLNSNK